MPSADTVENYQLVSIKSYSHPGEVQDHDLDSNDATSSHQQEASDVECLGTSEDNTTKRAIHRLSSSSRSSVEIAKQPNFFKFCVRPISDFCSSIDRRLTNRLRRSRYHGWRVGVLSALCMSTFVLCCNITLIVAGSVVNGGYDKDGVANLVYGNERTISRWNTTFHVLINALSTILLAGSNYTMQVLSSPTRLDIDKAHAKGNWLEIGLLSPRNLRIISRKRMALCLLLAVSSVPLHLFYNASVFKIVIANDYAIFAVDRQSDGYARLASSPDTYLNLTNAQWKNTYNEEYVSGHGDLYLAIDQLAFSTSPTTVSLNMSDYLPWTTRSTFQRMISPSSDWISFALGNVTVTTVKIPGQSLPQDSAGERVIDQLPVSMHVAHAFSRKTGPRSCIQISLYFMIVVVTFNSFKLIIMAYILVTDRSKYIVTLGDAAASFLEHPDSTTHGKCMLAMDKKLFSRGRPSCLSNLSNQNTRDISIYSTDVWRPRPQRYFSSVSFDKGSTSILSVLCLGIAVAIISATTSSSTNSWAWGSASDGMLFIGSNHASSKATILNAWLVNMPQILLSFCYLNINTICTAMACAQEWNTFGTTRKGLRVTDPAGEQRSTYFLQLPYKWAMPLLIVSGTLHWLLSQTFFLVRVDYYDRNLELKSNDSRAACGISFSSLIVFFCVTFGLVLAIRVVGRRRLHPKIPSAECCSLIISAACHPSNDEIEPHLNRVQWGVVEHEVQEGYAHCTLSARAVKRPEVGKRYH